MIFIGKPRTFSECWDQLWNKPEDFAARTNGGIVTKYFKGIDWSKPENWEAFFRELKAIDSFNGGQTWMFAFWNLFDDFDLFENDDFLIQYFNAIDPVSSVTCDPANFERFTAHVTKAKFDSLALAGKIPEEVSTVLNRINGFFWKR